MEPEEFNPSLKKKPTKNNPQKTQQIFVNFIFTLAHMWRLVLFSFFKLGTTAAGDNPQSMCRVLQTWQRPRCSYHSCWCSKN